MNRCSLEKIGFVSLAIGFLEQDGLLGPDDFTLQFEVQIIDTYFGRLHMVFAWREDLAPGIYMKPAAEDFLKEYQGCAAGAPMED